ncbi:hypothetical protein MBLNU230_g8334t2 [Neophaeotheca triangularis]
MTTQHHTSAPTSPDDPSSSASSDQPTDLPLPLAASVLLDQLPQTAQQALQTAGTPPQTKVKIRLSPLPNTPALSAPRFMCSSSQQFEFVVRFVRRKMLLKESESVFCYVNSTFAPGLDEGVGNLWRVSL